jgi:hypothetical protein
MDLYIYFALKDQRMLTPLFVIQLFLKIKIKIKIKNQESLS